MIGSYRLILSLWLALTLAIPQGLLAEKAKPNLPASAPVAPKTGASQIPSGSGNLKTPKAPSINAQVPGAKVVPQTPPLLPAPAAGLPAGIAVPAQAGAQQTLVEETPRLGGKLDERFDELRQAFDRRRDDLTQGDSFLDEKTGSLLVSHVRSNLHSQLDAMQKAEPEDEPLLSQIRQEGDGHLDEIARLLASGQIDPRVEIRASRENGPAPVQARELRVGFIPVAADPFQWGHLLIGLRSIAAFKLDKVIFVLAGDDPRKPNMTKVDFRHPMGQAVLKTFAPFFEYSSLAVGTSYDGETNLFRFLKLNPEQKMQAFYFAGKDHYKRKDKSGNPDTLPKLKNNMKRRALGFDSSKHKVKVVFIEREGGDAHVRTKLETFFLPSIPFEASSTLVRKGHHALMPYSAYEYAQRHRPGLYSIPEKKTP